MNNINIVVAKNFSNYRNKHNMSLDKISNLTGVSKNMLSQIEKGQSNPSIMTLSKIANGLHISLSQLVAYNVGDINKIEEEEVVPIYNENQSVAIYPYFPFNSKSDFEMFKMTIKPKSYMYSEGHFNNSDEYIIVTEGTLKIDINGIRHKVEQEQAIHFKSDVQHTYINESENKLSLIATIQYSK